MQFKAASAPLQRASRGRGIFQFGATPQNATALGVRRSDAALAWSPQNQAGRYPPVTEALPFFLGGYAFSGLTNRGGRGSMAVMLQPPLVETAERKVPVRYRDANVMAGREIAHSFTPALARSGLVSE